MSPSAGDRVGSRRSGDRLQLVCGRSRGGGGRSYFGGFRRRYQGAVPPFSFRRYRSTSLPLAEVIEEPYLPAEETEDWTEVEAIPQWLVLKLVGAASFGPQ
jgi:hypothetical protein